MDSATLPAASGQCKSVFQMLRLSLKERTLLFELAAALRRRCLLSGALGPRDTCRGSWVGVASGLRGVARRPGAKWPRTGNSPDPGEDRGCLAGGRYWIRTSDPFGVNEVRYRCANRPLREETLATTGRIAKSEWCWAGAGLASPSAVLLLVRPPTEPVGG